MTQVLVTGGSGYIGGWCVLALLDAGYDVRTTVRDLRREPALRAQLHAATGFADERLTVVAANLQSDLGWDEVVAGCEYVLHVASPTLRDGGASADEMVAVARGGVLRVLRAARDGGVSRVVLTSASGAVLYGHPPQQAPFTEEDWSDVDAGIPPYQLSKTLAERAAWQFVEEEGGGLELVAIQPVAVSGPLLGPDDPPSLRTIRGMLVGAMPVCPPFATGWVDVRDVADLHLKAMTDPAAAGERFIAIAGHSLRFVDVARILHDRLGERAAKVPSRQIPVLVAQIMSVWNPQLKAIRPQLGQYLDATSAKAQRVLGWRPRPIEDSIQDTAESLMANGALG